MARRIEKNIFDKLINGKLLGKRKIDLPVKYNFDAPRGRTQSPFFEKLYFPKNYLDRLIGNAFEKILPGLNYWFYKDEIYYAREHGYTLAEKFYGNFRHVHYKVLFGLSQMSHPFGYLDMQRRDQFIRKIYTLMPGITAPDWAQESKRVPDFDVNSISNLVEMKGEIYRESTPNQHFNQTLFTALQNIANMQWYFGRYAQRMFFNEELRGEFYRVGKLTEGDRKIIHGWYANGQADHQRDRFNNFSEEERQAVLENKERWDNNFARVFPEYLKGAKFHGVYHKYEEPYFERNMQNIRSSVFTKKWLDALNNKTFSDEEIQEIYQFFLGENLNSFFILGDSGEFEGTEIYNKFVNEMNFPDILLLDRLSTYPPEKQFYDALDNNWGIDFDTVDTYKRHYLNMIKNNSDSTVNGYVLEEVYNPLFRQILSESIGDSNVKQTESLTLKALEKGISINELKDISDKTNASTALTSSNVLDKMVNNAVRQVVKTLNQKP